MVEPQSSRSAAALQSILQAAQRARDAGAWDDAARLFRHAAQCVPDSAEIAQNLALVCFAKGDPGQARAAAERAIGRNPGLWQSHALLARLDHEAGDPARADAAWRTVLRHSPGNGTALVALADLAMNDFADPAAAIALVAPLADDRDHAADAALTQMMALLYCGGVGAAAQSARLTAFSRAHLRLPRMAPRPPRVGRRRIGIMSPMLAASPVYYLAFSGLAALAETHDLVFVNRGTRDDWATDRFRALACEWIDVAHVAPLPLAQRIAAADLDVVIDMGGWSDAPGLQALSTKPAPFLYKWIGGQSATTGLDVFDGWIGDVWQSPADARRLYAEPVINIAGGAIDYTPPADLAGLAGGRKRGAGLVGNPAKIGAACIAAWPSGIDRVRLIDRRYQHARVRDRITDLLTRAGITIDAIIVPDSHRAYLRDLAQCEAIVNTQPYAAGLTAVEALALGVRLLPTRRRGRLFCARHDLSHRRTGGRNPTLGAQLLALVGGRP